MDHADSFPFRGGAFARMTATRIRRQGRLVGPLARAFVRILQGLAITAGWRLDDVFYRDWREASFQGPIFIIGHWRTGTTFLHRSLATDALENGVAMNYAETHFPPITLRRLFETVSGGPIVGRDSVQETLRRLDDERFEEVDPLHRTRLRAIAEDAHLLKTMFASIRCMEAGPWTFDAPGVQEYLHPHTRPIAEQRRTLRAYRSTLVKNAYLSAADSPVVIAKNPEFSRRIPLLREFFPEAKFVYLARNPLESIASLLELIECIWEFGSPDASISEQHGTLLEPAHARYMLEHSIDIHQTVEQDLAEVPDDDKFVARFDEFVADPAEHVAALLEAFELEETTPDFRERIEARSKRVRAESDRDRATLGDFGIDEGEVVEPLAGYFERWGFAGGAECRAQSFDC